MKNSWFFLKTPKPQEAAIHVFENQYIEVGGVLKTSWIDLLTPINQISRIVYIDLDKYGQRLEFLEYFDF